MSSNGVRGKLAKGTAWISAAGALTNLLQLVTTLVLARLLAPADFGLVALATTLLAMITSVTELSLTSALVQLRAPTDHHFHTAWTLSFARNGALAGIICAAALPAASIYRSPHLAPVMFVLAGSLACAGLNNPRAIIVTKRLVFWQQAMMQVAQKLITLIVSVVLAILYKTYWALVWGSVASTIVNVFLSYMVMPMRPRFSVRHYRDLLGFSIWLSFGQIINTLNYNFDQLIIGGMLGRQSLGYYTVGNNLAIMPTREATAPITNTLFPAFSNLMDDRSRLARAYQSAQALVTAIALPAGVGMALVADPMVRLVMGERWRPAVFLIQALAAVFAFQTLGTLSQPLAMAAGETRLLFWRDLQNFVIRIPFIVAGLLLGGLNGIIYARILTGSIAIIFHMQVVKKITGLSPASQLAVNARSLTSIVVMAVVVLIIAPRIPTIRPGPIGLSIEIGILVSVGAATYLLTHVGLWIAQRRPDGPEREVVRVLAVLRRRFGGAPIASL
jgi:O-antigen/teichoic acid export membrane protein